MADFLELPEELRRFVAASAPMRAAAVRFEAKVKGSLRTFQAGLWNEGFLSESQQFSLRIYCTSDGETFYKAGSFRLPSPNISQVPPERLIRRARIGIEANDVGLLVPLDEIAHIVIRAQSSHLIVKGEGISLTEGENFSENFWEFSQLRHAARVRAAFATQNHYFQEARSWLEMTQSERLAFVMRCENGTFEEVAHLHDNLAIVGYSTALSPEEEHFYWDWNAQAAPFYSSEKRFFESWRAAILSHFRPPLLCQPKMPMWVRCFSTPEIICKILTPPTAHELLEAQLFLAEWVRENCPEKATELLSFPA